MFENVTGLKFIEATSLEDAWRQALYNVVRHGRRYLISQGSYEGNQRAGLPLVINIKYPGTEPLCPSMPPGLPAPTDMEHIEAYRDRYLMSNIKEENEHYTYGEDLWWQIDWVINYFRKMVEVETTNGKELVQNFGTNHCYMTVGRPETIYNYDSTVDCDQIIIVKDRASGNVLDFKHLTNSWNKNPKNKKSSQCLRGIDTWIDNGKLHFWCYFRSWDLWGGFPENLGGIQLVKKFMAGCIGVEDGCLIASSKDLHVYDHTWEVADTLTKVSLFNLAEEMYKKQKAA